MNGVVVPSSSLDMSRLFGELLLDVFLSTGVVNANDAALARACDFETLFTPQHRAKEARDLLVVIGHEVELDE